MTPCPKCGDDVADHLARCPACNTAAGYPNVKQSALDALQLAIRVDAARADAGARDAGQALVELERALGDSKAVVNLDVEFLFRLLTDEKVLFASYGKLVEAGVRVPASFEDDRQRTGVEAILFGRFGHELTYGALALDGRGLGSYGPVSIELKTLMIDDRASVLEENSYTFVKKHGLTPSAPLPQGFRAPWPRRSQVGVAKLARLVTSATTSAEHAGLLLHSDGVDRHKDEFIEVHIFGPFNRKAIASITVLAAPKDAADRQRLKKARRVAEKQGIGWREP